MSRLPAGRFPGVRQWNAGLRKHFRQASRTWIRPWKWLDPLPRHRAQLQASGHILTQYDKLAALSERAEVTSQSLTQTSTSRRPPFLLICHKAGETEPRWHERVSAETGSWVPACARVKEGANANCPSADCGCR